MVDPAAAKMRQGCASQSPVRDGDRNPPEAPGLRRAPKVRSCHRRHVRREPRWFRFDYPDTQYFTAFVINSLIMRAIGIARSVMTSMPASAATSIRQPDAASPRSWQTSPTLSSSQLTGGSCRSIVSGWDEPCPYLTQRRQGTALILKWPTPWCPRNVVLFGRGIVNEPLTVDERNFKVGEHVIGNRLNGGADNKRVSSQDRFPNGRKVRVAMRSGVASDQQIVCGFNHFYIRSGVLLSAFATTR